MIKRRKNNFFFQKFLALYLRLTVSISFSVIGSFKKYFIFIFSFTYILFVYLFNVTLEQNGETLKKS